MSREFDDDPWYNAMVRGDIEVDDLVDHGNMTLDEMIMNNKILQHQWEFECEQDGISKNTKEEYRNRVIKT